MVVVEKAAETEEEATEAVTVEEVKVAARVEVGNGVDGTCDLRLPRHSAEAFKNFLTWFALDRERSRSMESMIRSAGSYMTKLKLPDVTKLPEVKAHTKDLLDEIGIDHESATTATPRMLELTVKDGGVIDTRFRNSFIAAREKVQFVTEGLGGCRIGEVAGGGDDHGLLANNVCILEDMDPVRAKEREKFHGIGGVVVES